MEPQPSNPERAQEEDCKNRQALLHKIQQLACERVLYIPLYALVWDTGVGPRVEEHTPGKIPLHYHTAAFEDMRLKGQ